MEPYLPQLEALPGLDMTSIHKLGRYPSKAMLEEFGGSIAQRRIARDLLARSRMRNCGTR